MHSNNHLPLKVLLAGIVMLAFSVLASGQTVSNVDANQEGKSIAITYDLKETSHVSLFVTQDGGNTKKQISRNYLVGDVGSRISAGKNKRILWHVLEQYPDQNFQGENMSFIVQAEPVMRFFALFNAGYSLDSGMTAGITLGQMGQFGWYAKAITTLSLPKSADFECDDKGLIDGILPFFSGNSASFKAYAVAGALLRVAPSLYLNAGLGYGSRTCNWELFDGRWVKNVPLSYSGLAIDAGIIARFSNIALSAGATLLGGNVDLCLGIGYVF